MPLCQSSTSDGIALIRVTASSAVTRCADQVAAASDLNAPRACRRSRTSRFDVAQTLSPRQLSERHGAELFGTGQRAHARIATVTLNDSSEAGPWHALHDPGEQSLANIRALLRIVKPWKVRRFRAIKIQIGTKQNLSATRAHVHFVPRQRSFNRTVVEMIAAATVEMRACC
jgi:hypothetical protein